MIDTACRTAALGLPGYRDALRLLGENHSRTIFLRNQIEQGHLDCKGGTWCDCHHDIEMSLISQAKEAEQPVKGVVE